MHVRAAVLQNQLWQPIMLLHRRMPHLLMESVTTTMNMIAMRVGFQLIFHPLQREFATSYSIGIAPYHTAKILFVRLIFRQCVIAQYNISKCTITVRNRKRLNNATKVNHR